MRSLRRLIHRVFGLLWSRGADRELSDEIESHLQFHVDDNIRAGMPPSEARRQALLKFGALESVKDQHRDQRGIPALDRLGQDVRYGARLLRRNPGFTMIAVVTVAVGVGVNTGMFSVLNAAAFRSLNLPGSDRLVTIGQTFTGRIHRNVHGMPSLVSYAEYHAYRDDNRVFSGLLAYMPCVEVTLGGEHPQELVGTMTSCNYFDVLDVRPALGRGFRAFDCAGPGASAAAIISDALWRGAFGADPAVVGRTIALNRTPFTVIGVAPPNFNGTEAIQSAFYAPVTMQSALVPDREFLSDDDLSWLVLIGRLRPGATIAQARADLAVIAARADAQHKGRTTHVLLSPATLASVPEVRSIVLGIGGVILLSVGLVLLIACANLANLLLARAMTRRREVALRQAIGASRWRIVQQFLVESVMLAAIGGAAGSLLSFWGSAGAVRYLLGHLPGGSPSFAFDVTPDLWVFWYALGLTLATGVAFGIVPAFRSARTDLTGALKQDDDRNGPGRAGRLRGLLIGTQAGVCAVLLVACALTTRALIQTQTLDVGFNTDGIVGVSYDLAGAGYTPAHAASFERQLVNQLMAVPGISRVVPAGTSPLSGDRSATDFSSPTGAKELQLEFTPVAPGYFSLLGIPIVSGRDFSVEEARGSTPVVIVNQSAASRLWPDGDPLGAVLTFNKKTAVVVGVARDSQVSRLGMPDSPMIFIVDTIADAQHNQLLVQTTLGPAATSKAIRTAAASLDPQLVLNVASLSDNLELWRTPARIATALAGALGFIALVLACTGVFGTVAYAVSRRAREIGIRIALGAAATDVMRLMMKQAMRPVLIGLTLGLAAAAAVSSVFSSLLVGISAHDPLSFAAAGAVLAGSALAAAYWPTRRALRVEPTVVLRHE